MAYLDYNGLEYLKGKLDDTYETIADANVLKNVVDEKTYGFSNVVNFSSGMVKSAKSLIIDVPLVQEGTGTPSINNVRNFHKYTQFTVKQSDADITTPTETVLKLSPTSNFYNGEVDVINGKYVRKMRIITMDGVNTKVTNKGSGTNNYYFNTSNLSTMGTSSGWVSIDTLNSYGCMCTHLPPATSSTVDSSAGGFGLYISSSNKQPRIFPPSSLNISTIDQCNNWLKTLYDNNTPLMIAYPYLTPYQYSVATTITLNTLIGENNIWSDDGDVKVVISSLSDSIEDEVNGNFWYSKQGSDIDSVYFDYIEPFINTDSFESFMFFTDSHIGSAPAINEDVVFNAVKNLEKAYKSFPVNFCLYGGDTLASDALSPYLPSEQAAYFLSYVNQLFYHSLGEDNFLSVVGNHDYNYESYSGTDLLTNQDMENILFRNKENCYYSYKTLHSTVYALNTGLNKTDNGQGSYSVPMDTYKWQQIKWLGDSLVNDNPQHAIIAMHIIVNNNTGHPKFTMYENASLLCAAYNSHTTITLNDILYDFSACTGRVELFVGGHVHADEHGIDNGIPYVVRRDMTTNETPNCDMVFCDWQNRFALFKRIGEGTDLKINIDNGNEIA